MTFLSFRAHLIPLEYRDVKKSIVHRFDSVHVHSEKYPLTRQAVRAAYPDFIAIMTLLVIEDDPKTGDYLKKGLGESGYQVDLARDGATGLQWALNQDYQLIILDQMLPGIDGWQIMAALRAKRDTPVIFLTARDQLEDRIQGLQLGADDYLVKPFSFIELTLRIKTLLRRGVTRESDTFQVADLHVDVLKRKASRQGMDITLTNKEFALLHLFCKREGEALSRTLIASEVWDMNFDSDTNVVDVAVKRLRAKIDQPFPIKLIHTVRSIGYSFGIVEGG